MPILQFIKKKKKKKCQFYKGEEEDFIFLKTNWVIRDGNDNLVALCTSYFRGPYDHLWHIKLHVHNQICGSLELWNHTFWALQNTNSKKKISMKTHRLRPWAKGLKGFSPLLGLFPPYPCCVNISLYWRSPLCKERS